MPRRVDYASRFQFFREAAFAIVRDRGVAALSRRALAEELGISRNRVDDILRSEADLRVLAADTVRQRRTTGRFGPIDGDPMTEAVTVAMNRVARVMPDEPQRIDEELVWLRLLVEGPRASSPIRDPEGPLWMRYQVAERGYVYDERPGERLSEPNAGPQPDALADSLADSLANSLADVLANHRAQHEKSIAWQLDRALEHVGLDPESRATEMPRLRALVDGLIVAICLGRITPEAGLDIVRKHLTSLARPQTNDADAA